MSNVQSGMEPPIGNVTPAKSGKKIWIFAGVGCLLVGLLCLAGVGVLGYIGMGAVTEITASIDAIANSPDVQAELGSPLTVIPDQRQNSNGQEITMTGTVEGPNGRGTYSVLLEVEGVTSFTTKSITVEANGKTIVVGDDLAEIEEGLGSDELDVDFGDQ